MLNDLTLKLHESRKGFILTRTDAVPPVMQAAITLLLFTQNEDFRIFDGESIYTVLPVATSGSIDYLQAQLAMLNVTLYEYLSDNYPELNNCDISTELLDENRLVVTLTLTMGDEDITEIIYEDTIEG